VVEKISNSLLDYLCCSHNIGSCLWSSSSVLFFCGFICDNIEYNIFVLLLFFSFHQKDRTLLSLSLSLSLSLNIQTQIHTFVHNLSFSFMIDKIRYHLHYYCTCHSSLFLYCWSLCDSKFEIFQEISCFTNEHSKEITQKGM
jgi:hypothetical protein